MTHLQGTRLSTTLSRDASRRVRGEGLSEPGEPSREPSRVPRNHISRPWGVECDRARSSATENLQRVMRMPTVHRQVAWSIRPISPPDTPTTSGTPGVVEGPLRLGVECGDVGSTRCQPARSSGPGASTRRVAGRSVRSSTHRPPCATCRSSSRSKPCLGRCCLGCCRSSSARSLADPRCQPGHARQLVHP